MILIVLFFFLNFGDGNGTARESDDVPQDGIFVDHTQFVSVFIFIGACREDWRNKCS